MSLKERVISWFQSERIIWLIYLMLVLVSILMLFSTSVGLVEKDVTIYKPVLVHTAILLLAGALMFAIQFIPLKWFNTILIWVFYVIVFVMQVLTFVGPYRKVINHASRWIQLGPLVIQPSVFLKVLVIMAVAHLMSKYEKLKDTNEVRANRCYWGAFATFAIPAAMVAYSNMSTGCIIAATGFFVMFFGGMKIKHLIMMVVCALLLGGGLYGAHRAGHVFPGHMHTALNRVDQILLPSDPEHKYDIDPSDNAHYQPRLCKVAIANGVVPCGPGNSAVSDTLPLAFADCIFAIIVEETGLFGAAFIIMLYLAILYQGGKLAVRSPDLFSALIVSGLSILVVLQAVISMLVVCGIGPNTGQPLPFISWGKWDILTMGCIFGVLLSSSRHINKTQEKTNVEIANTPKTKANQRRKRKTNGNKSTNDEQLEVISF